MKTIMKRVLAGVVAIAVLASGATEPWAMHASAESGAATSGVVDVYPIDGQKAGFRTTLSSADTFTTAAILATTAFVLVKSPSGQVRQTLSVGGRFSASGQTCVVRFVYVFKADPTSSTFDTTTEVIKGYSAPITLSGGATQYEGSYYPSDDALADSGGATDVRILLITAPASGSVSLWVGSR